MRTCIACDEPILRKRNGQFCSRACANRSRGPRPPATKRMVALVCAYQPCAKSFEVWPYRLRRSDAKVQYCSQTCYHADQTGKPLATAAHAKRDEWLAINTLPHAFPKGHVPWNRDTSGVTKAWNKGLKLPQLSGEFHPGWKGGLPKCGSCGTGLGSRYNKHGLCNGCIGQVTSGANHYNWQGGKTPEHRKIRTSREYARWRKAVFERDDYTCQSCGTRGGELHADHIKSFADHPDLRLDINNGRTLCAPCHRKTPNYAGRGRARKSS